MLMIINSFNRRNISRRDSAPRYRLARFDVWHPMFALTFNS